LNCYLEAQLNNVANLCIVYDRQWEKMTNNSVTITSSQYSSCSVLIKDL